MAVSIEGRYLGNKNVELTHGPSGTIIKTAAPVDNNGDGSSFSPTDLASSSLAACMMTIMGIIAERDGIDLSGANFSLEKHMGTEPRRISRIPISFHLPKSLTEDERKKLERAAMTCPVHHSLHPEIEAEISFNYDLM